MEVWNVKRKCNDSVLLGVLLQLVCFGTPYKLSGTGLLVSMRCGAYFMDICYSERMQCKAVQCNAMQSSAVQCNVMQCSAVRCSAVTEGRTSSSIFRRSSTTGSKFAASLGKNLTTTLYPLNHRQAYVTAVEATLMLSSLHMLMASQ